METYRVQLYDLGVRPTLVRIEHLLWRVQILIHDPAGWDPIFEYEGKTYAEMDKEAKV